MKKVLITGGAGFIGSHLTNFFLEKNARVIVIDNFITGNRQNIEPFLDNSLFTLINEDILTTSLDSVFSKFGTFDIIYHLASPASPKQYILHPIKTLMVNSFGTQKLCEALRQKKAKKLVFTSTSEVYGDPKEHPQKESYWGNVNPIGPRACYDEAKRFGEAVIVSYINKHNVDARIARIFNTYGPNMEKNDGRVISNFIVQALTNKPLTIYGKGSQTRSFCYVDDMVKALYLFGEKPVKGEVINIGNTDEQKIINTAKKILKLSNSKSKIAFKPLPEDDPKRRKPNIDKAKRLLGWKPKTILNIGLEKTIKYFRNRFNL